MGFYICFCVRMSRVWTQSPAPAPFARTGQCPSSALAGRLVSRGWARLSRAVCGAPGTSPVSGRRFVRSLSGGDFWGRPQVVPHKNTYSNILFLQTPNMLTFYRVLGIHLIWLFKFIAPSWPYITLLSLRLLPLLCAFHPSISMEVGRLARQSTRIARRRAHPRGRLTGACPPQESLPQGASRDLPSIQA